MRTNIAFTPAFARTIKHRNFNADVISKRIGSWMSYADTRSLGRLPMNAAQILIIAVFVGDDLV